jgi:hypothetical protein
VAEKGAKDPIFEGNMLPQEMYPKIGANIGAITGILLTRDNMKAVKQDEFFNLFREQDVFFQLVLRTS